MQNITAEDMMQLQTDNYNVFAEMARPLLLKYLNVTDLDAAAKDCLTTLESWNLRNDIGEKGATLFALTWEALEQAVFGDEFSKTQLPLPWPHESTLLEALLKDSAFSFVDNVTTPAIETVNDIITASFRDAVTNFNKLDTQGEGEWGTYKDTRVNHLAKIPSFSRQHLPIGGGEHIINATKKDHGPSWRMVVHLDKATEAYGIYPGGQSGNPGSKYYDTYVDGWAKGEYNKLWLMTKNELSDKRIKWTILFNK